MHCPCCNSRDGTAVHCHTHRASQQTQRRPGPGARSCQRPSTRCRCAARASIRHRVHRHSHARSPQDAQQGRPEGRGGGGRCGEEFPGVGAPEDAARQLHRQQRQVRCSRCLVRACACSARISCAVQSAAPTASPLRTLAWCQSCACSFVQLCCSLRRQLPSHTSSMDSLADCSWSLPAETGEPSQTSIASGKQSWGWATAGGCASYPALRSLASRRRQNG